jgi:predicted AAA+ superfamily ATPase
MAHTRKRLIAQVILKRMKLWPCLNLLGVRQCGKSTLIRDILWPKNNLSYVTLDKAADRRMANDSPALFLSNFENYPIVVDEAHKAPDLFDEIKSDIDQKRIPGKYLLTGSVNFGLKVGIKESLTGRSATIKMEPLSILETLELLQQKKHTLTLNAVRKHLELGGMPGVCFLRSETERTSYWNEWLETTCSRDLKQFSNGKLSSDLAIQILHEVAITEFAEAHQIAKKVRQDRRRVQNHLDALIDLFVIREVMPHPNSGSGKALYYLFDPGLVSHLGGNLRKKWQAWLLLEKSILDSSLGVKGAGIQYYKSRGGLFADFVTQKHVHFYSEHVGLDQGMKIRAENALLKLPGISAVIHQPKESDSYQKKTSKIMAVSWCELIKFLN